MKMSKVPVLEITIIGETLLKDTEGGFQPASVVSHVSGVTSLIKTSDGSSVFLNISVVRLVAAVMTTSGGP
jgi:hypothetical protein